MARKGTQLGVFFLLLCWWTASADQGNKARFKNRLPIDEMFKQPSFQRWNEILHVQENCLELGRRSAGEPNDHNQKEECVHTDIKDREWNDRACSQGFLFALCQIENFEDKFYNGCQPRNLWCPTVLDVDRKRVRHWGVCQWLCKEKNTDCWSNSMNMEQPKHLLSTTTRNCSRNLQLISSQSFDKLAKVNQTQANLTEKEKWQCMGRYIGINEPCRNECFGGQILCNGVCSNSDEHWACNNTCIRKSRPCNEVCPSDYYNCDGACKDLKKENMWVCNGTCLPDSYACNDVCKYFGFVNCNGKCFNELTDHLWKCRNECISKTKPCNGVCFGNYILCDEKCVDPFTTKLISCQGKCVSVYEPCNNTCPYHLINCNNTCIDGYANNLWKCNDKCISRDQTCNGKCKSYFYDCGGLCVDLKKIWTCHGSCIPLNQPCDGRCLNADHIECNGTCIDHIASGLMKCQNQCIAKNEPCKGNCFYSNHIICNETCVSADTSHVWICNGMCLSKNAPCQEKCFDDYIYCNKTCLNPLFANVWKCNGECISKNSLCNGKCPLEYVIQNGVCIDPKSNEWWQCQSQWILSDEPCNGTCFNDHILCNGKCINSVTEHVRQCNDQCVPVSEPCDGECATKYFNCNGTCLHLETSNYWSCNGQCISKSLPCMNNCFNSKLSICQGKCVDGNEVWMCYEQCLFRTQPCHGVCYFDYYIAVNGTCFDPRQSDCLCNGCSRCKHSEECILESDVCNGKFDCMDRTDEEDWPQKEEIELSSLHICTTINGESGFLCGHKNICVPSNVWCSFNEVIEKTLIKKYHCPQLHGILNHYSFCQDRRFWAKFSNRCKSGPCNGNFPGQCSEFGCHDFSDKTGSQYCEHKNFRFCTDNKTCIHQDLFCDGYIHCPDGSDEDVKSCAQCPRLFGYPSGKSEQATLNCKHKYTGRPICAVPCDGTLDLCEDDLDEICSLPLSYWSLGFGGAILLFTIFIGEVKMLFSRRRQRYSNILSEDLLQLLVKGPSNHSHFKTIHKNPSYRQSCHVLYLCLQILPHKERTAILNAFFRLEKEFHCGDNTDSFKCMQLYFGTKSKTFSLPTCQSNKSQTYNFFLNAKFILVVITKIILYYSDLFKDTYIMAVFFKYSYSKQEVFRDEAFVSEVCFILMAVSILCPLIINTILLYTKLEVWAEYKVEKSLGWLFSPTVMAVLIYTIEKLNYLEQKLAKEKTFYDDKHFKRRLEQLNYIYQTRADLKKLTATLKMTESSIEHHIQTIVVLIVTLLRFQRSDTTLVNFSRSGFDFFASGNKSFLIFSIIWSLMSIIFSFCHFSKSSKNNLVTTKAFLFHFIFAACSMFCRISAIILFCIPALDLFEVLNIRYFYFKRNITEPEAILFIVPVERLVILSELKYWSALATILFGHIILIFITKIFFANGFFTRRNFFAKLQHVLHNITTPNIWQDWDECDINGSEDARKKFSKVCLEMKAMLVLFTLENIVLCFPMFLLCSSMFDRNEYLNSYPFGPIAPEIHATIVTYTLTLLGPIVLATVPFFQYWIFKRCHLHYHPWSIFLNPSAQQSREDTLDKLWKVLKMAKLKVFIRLQVLTKRPRRKLKRLSEPLFADQEDIFLDFWKLIVTTGLRAEAQVLFRQDTCVIRGLGKDCYIDDINHDIER